MRARQARGLGNTRRPDASPQRFLTFGGGRARTGSRKVGGSSRRRGNGADSRREPEVANGRGEHPARAVSAGGRMSAANALPDDRAHRTRPHLAGRHGARRSIGARRPSCLGGEPKGTHPEPWRCFDPPLVHVRIVVRRSLGLGTTPGASFAGAHGSDGGLSARRDAREQGVPAIDEVSTVMAEDRPSDASAEGLFLLGRDFDAEGQTRGAPPHVP